MCCRSKCNIQLGREEGEEQTNEQTKQG
jgi:hypothetical protein